MWAGPAGAQVNTRQRKTEPFAANPRVYTTLTRHAKRGYVLSRRWRNVILTGEVVCPNWFVPFAGTVHRRRYDDSCRAAGARDDDGDHADNDDNDNDGHGKHGGR